MAYRGFTIGSRHTGVNGEQGHRISPFRKGGFLFRSIACKHPIPGPGQDECSTKTGQRQSLQHSPPRSCGVGGDDLQWLADGVILDKKIKKKVEHDRDMLRRASHWETQDGKGGGRLARLLSLSLSLSADYRRYRCR